MPNRHDIHVLNALIGATLDSADRLDQIAGDSEGAGHGSLFSSLATERRRMARTLSDAVTALGGLVDGGSSILSKAQRAVQDIGHALIRDEAGLVDTADRGEAALDRRFEAALTDERIAATTRETIRRAHALIHRETAEVPDLSRSVDGQRDASSGLFPQ